MPSRMKANMRDHNGIIHICRLLSQEARPVLAASLELNLVGAESYRAVATVGVFYRPLIQCMTATDCELSLKHLGMFTGLRCLHLHDDAQNEALDMWEINQCLSAKARDALAGGALDKKLKQNSREKCLFQLQWIKNIFELPGRSFQITSYLKLDWCFRERGDGDLVSKIL